MTEPQALVDIWPSIVDNIEMGMLFEDLIRRFNEQANETAGDHFTPREVISLMARRRASLHQGQCPRYPDRPCFFMVLSVEEG